MPKAVEECVKKISGTNPRTGKSYTQSEKWAICTARVKKSGKSEEQISTEVANATYNFSMNLYNSGKARNFAEAYDMTQSTLQKIDYNYEVLELIVDK